jgi:transposase
VAVLTFPASVRIFVCAEPVDLRRGFDRLASAAREVVRQDPASGHVFAFLNRRRDRIKMLVWDRTGYLLLYKRLSRGTFSLPSRPLPGRRHIEVDGAHLMMMLEGIELATARRRRRYQRQA